MSKIKFAVIVLIVLLLGACSDFQEAAPPSSTPQPPRTDTPIPSNTPTAVPPTETPVPSPTLPSDIWLDTTTYELLVEHPNSPDQTDWGTTNEIIFPADGFVGGFVFTAEEVNGVWGPAGSTGVIPENSITKNSSKRENPPGEYCVADYVPKYSPINICQILAPEATQINWIRPYYAGPKTEVGIAFSVGACSPKSCTAFLRISNIRLIYYSLPE